MPSAKRKWPPSSVIVSWRGRISVVCESNPACWAKTLPAFVPLGTSPIETRSSRTDTPLFGSGPSIVPPIEAEACTSSAAASPVAVAPVAASTTGVPAAGAAAAPPGPAAPVAPAVVGSAAASPVEPAAPAAGGAATVVVGAAEPDEPTLRIARTAPPAHSATSSRSATSERNVRGISVNWVSVPVALVGVDAPWALTTKPQWRSRNTAGRWARSRPGTRAWPPGARVTVGYRSLADTPSPVAVRATCNDSVPWLCSSTRMRPPMRPRCLRGLTCIDRAAADAVWTENVAVAPAPPPRRSPATTAIWRVPAAASSGSATRRVVVADSPGASVPMASPPSTRPPSSPATSSTGSTGRGPLFVTVTVTGTSAPGAACDSWSWISTSSMAGPS